MGDREPVAKPDAARWLSGSAQSTALRSFWLEVRRRLSELLAKPDAGDVASFAAQIDRARAGAGLKDGAGVDVLTLAIADVVDSASPLDLLSEIVGEKRKSDLLLGALLPAWVQDVIKSLCDTAHKSVHLGFRKICHHCLVIPPVSA